MKQQDYYVYISGWTNFGGTGGLHGYRMNGESGELEYGQTYCEETSFNMSIVDRERNLLYALNETPDLPEAELVGGGGSLYIFKINPSDGTLTKVQQIPSYGANPCYVSIDPQKKFLVIAHHASHAYTTHVKRGADGKYHIFVEHDDVTLCLFPMNGDGTVGDPVDVVKHTGWLPSKKIPNAGMHTACFSPSGEIVAVVDIAESRIHMYKIDYEHGKLYPCAAPYAEEHDLLPRYCLFHPSLPYFFVNHEMGSLDIFTYRYTEKGELEFVSSTSSVPADHQWKYHDEQQDMRMHPNGKYIYDAVNGPEYISVLQIDEETGKLELIQNKKLKGEWARSCAVSPDGRFLIATCLISGDIDVFRIGEDGTLEDTGIHTRQSAAAWSTFYPIEKQ
ncbi:MAG: lactonase family protein [Lachnospiraceae bacterium]|jgi:6-phosphogluconolactonase